MWSHKCPGHGHLAKNARQSWCDDQGYWNLVISLCSYLDPSKEQAPGLVVPNEILSEILQTFEGKSSNELNTLKEEIQSSTVQGVDEEFWMTVLVKINIHLTKVQFEETTTRYFEEKVSKLANENDRTQWRTKRAVGPVPPLLRDVNSQEENVAATYTPAEERLLRFQKEILLEEGEEEFNREHDGKQKDNATRKPLFFNTYKSSNVWNAYTRCHHKEDDPPPKRVVGYKFNIFVPELVDKTKSPEYVLETDEEGNTNFVVLCFKLGEPYLDVRFKIVAGEWMNSWKDGFKSSFAGGVLRLWFIYKVYRYRI